MVIPVFYSYSHKDESYKDTLQTHLSILKRQGFIDGWNDRRIAPGENWEEEINLNLQKAKIVFLLVSSNFLASDYCYDSETIFALEQHEKKSCIVIPIIIKPCLWTLSPFKNLQALPKNGKAITTWKNKDEAWLNVSEGILKVIESLNENDNIISQSHQGSNNSVVIKDNPSNQQAEKIFNIDKIDNAFFGEEVIVPRESLKDILLRFLSKFSSFYFSPLRIVKWGSEQSGFKKLSNYSMEMIQNELEILFQSQEVSMTKNKKGNNIYKINLSRPLFS